eukprot:5884993-Pyramimonas_sp.AAC.1
MALECYHIDAQVDSSDEGEGQGHEESETQLDQVLGGSLRDGLTNELRTSHGFQGLDVVDLADVQLTHAHGIL